MPTVSVTATVLNEAGAIDELVTSLMRQTFAATEVVIVDGGSTDGTWDRLQSAKARHASLITIRDESCSLQGSPGPIARGRNVAIAATSSEVVACTDAGCSYRADWLANLTAPILNGQAEYALGGTCLDQQERTKWDIASAPFFGIKLSPQQTTKSCTTRSMAFRKELWERIGGFPETVFFGEDTLFDLKARRLVTPAFVDSAKAFYKPCHTFRSAMRQMARYAVADGVLGVRPARLMRNLARCVVEVLAIVALLWTPVPLLCVLALETYFAFRLDWRDLRGFSVRVLAARWWFSLLVPWVVVWNQVVGSVTKAYLPNPQNSN